MKDSFLHLLRRLLPLASGIFLFHTSPAQAPAGLWHGIEREIHYRPDGADFVLVKGTRRFNRALYGGNTAFRAEAGDLPEFALYLPGMGGNLKFGIVRGDSSKWLINAKKIETRYRPGSMLYAIEDPLLGSGTIFLTAIALYDTEGFVVKAEGKSLPPDVRLVAVYGGATGQKFSRDGDIGADPESSFYLKPEYCSDNRYTLNGSRFLLSFGTKKPLSEDERYEVQHLPGRKTDSTAGGASGKYISGFFPQSARLNIADASQLASPATLLSSQKSLAPLVAATVSFGNKPLYFLLQAGNVQNSPDAAAVFSKAEASRQQLAGRIKVETPDPFINTLGGALGIAADAVWESPSFLHGAVAWRIRLNGWRGAYLADVLGWHDRGRQHFSAYAKSQVTTPADGPAVMDTALHLGRGLEKMGTSLFSSGYISRNPGGDWRPHHYDMNLVFIDQLLTHFHWTGDTAYLRQMWPLLVRHLNWEKRNFDRDGDGLYDAYAAIWASDALQYSGGGVAHSSAYNYRSNMLAAELAKLIGEDGSGYEAEAKKIRGAMNEKLWLPDRGWLAEYKDLLGNQLVHPYAGLWTIYHALDSKTPDAFQAWQMLKYVDSEIPHIPVRAKGSADTTLYTLSTTNWQPYTWSLNNVVLGEVQHTALAYWQGGRGEEAFKLFKSSLVESMYLGASPGNFHQLSFYDAVRGELYRDFADDIGTTARSLVEGLFGIQPDLLNGSLKIRPGFPAGWNSASLATPDITYSFRRSGNNDRYTLRPSFKTPVRLSLEITATRSDVASITVNGKKARWRFDSMAVGAPLLLVDAPAAALFDVQITWKGNPAEKPAERATYTAGDPIVFSFTDATAVTVFDPQKVLTDVALSGKRFRAAVRKGEGTKTFFLKLKQGSATYWMPYSFALKNTGNGIARGAVNGRYEPVDLSSSFNDDVKNIFKNQYLSPRPQTTTLQLPTQGIGNWAYPLTTANIDDAGLRKRAGEKRAFTTGDGVPFLTPSEAGAKNILFTSQWDNYPKEATIPLQGKAAAAYCLMAGSTNPMQSRLVNGEIIAQYKDGSRDTLALRNPENWWPIEQDYYEDGFAFTTGAAKPLRVCLKTGEDTRAFKNFVSIKGFSTRGIDGGAATVLSMPLRSDKELQSLTLRTVANDVVIGLMSLTLVRP